MAAGDKITIARIIDIDDATSSIVTTATGTILTFSNVVVPTGFLECNGAAISRTVYANLFAVIGTLYGVGDGSTTFNIPDLRGEFIRGFDNGRGVDSGRTIGSWQVDMFETHEHNIVGVNGWSVSGSGGITYTSGAAYGANVYAGAPRSGSFGEETRPRNVAMMYCIKY